MSLHRIQQAERPEAPVAAGPLVAAAISVRRAGRVVVDAVSFAAVPGHVLAVTGPSGAGKSTLLSVLAGVVAPDGGTVTYAGAALRAGDDGHLRRCAYVIQGYGLVNTLTGTENVELPLQLRRLDPVEIEDAARRALDRLGLPQVLDRLVDELSGGQQQRVAVARALAAQPEVLVADEPTAELDTGNRDLVVSALRAEATRGAVVVVATHDPEVAAACDDEVHLVDGRMVTGSIAG
jgi:putative ABC transport system ATP-binding protein